MCRGRDPRVLLTTPFSFPDTPSPSLISLDSRISVSCLEARSVARWHQRPLMQFPSHNVGVNGLGQLLINDLNENVVTAAVPMTKECAADTLPSWHHLPCPTATAICKSHPCQIPAASADINPQPRRHHSSKPDFPRSLLLAEGPARPARPASKCRGTRGEMRCQDLGAHCKASRQHVWAFFES